MRRITRLILVIMIPLMAGCQIGPHVFRLGHQGYNEAVRRTTDEQMLLNLVRMRYYEEPLFLQVSSITASFGISAGIGASSTFVEDNVNGIDNANSWGVNGNINYDERPTITFAIPDSREFYGRLLAPLSAQQVTSLAEAGWGTEQVFRLTIKKINRLQNIKKAAADAPEIPKSYPQFRELLELIKTLLLNEQIDFGPILKEAKWSAPVSSIKGRDLTEALALGAEFIEIEPKKYQLYNYSRQLALRFSPASDENPDAQRLREILGLHPEHYIFEFIDTESGNTEMGLAFLRQAPAALDPDAIFIDLTLQNRSMLEIMNFLAYGVDVPKAHLDDGIAEAQHLDVIAQLDDLYGDDHLFSIHSSRWRPRDATVKVQHRGYWFYIDDHDLQSRSTFALVKALFAVTAGTVPGAQPVLTLPVAR